MLIPSATAYVHSSAIRVHFRVIFRIPILIGFCKGGETLNFDLFSDIDVRHQKKITNKFSKEKIFFFGRRGREKYFKQIKRTSRWDLVKVQRLEE